MFCIIPFYSSFLLMIKLTANLSHLFAGNSYNKLNNWEVEDSKKKKKTDMVQASSHKKYS
jgi:hypothetical protein